MKKVDSKIMQINKLKKINLISKLEDCDCGEDVLGKLFNSSGLSDRIYETQLAQKQIIINHPIDDSIIEKAVIQIFNINKVDDEMEAVQVGYEREPIEILLNTIGGNASEAFSLISAIESSITPVNTIALGKVFSAGFLILLAGHKRYAQSRSTLMYHQGQSINIGEFSRMIEYAEYCKQMQLNVEAYVAEKSNITSKKLKEIFHQKQDWYMTASEALELGVIDDII